jgi:hypothetical protein
VPASVKQQNEYFAAFRAALPDLKLSRKASGRTVPIVLRLSRRYRTEITDTFHSPLYHVVFAGKKALDGRFNTYLTSYKFFIYRS